MADLRPETRSHHTAFLRVWLKAFRLITGLLTYALSSFTSKHKSPALHGRSSARTQHTIRDRPAAYDRFRSRRQVPARASQGRAGTCDHAKQKSDRKSTRLNSSHG